MEFANGDLYGVPFFMFTAKDEALLEPGWKTWLEAEDDHECWADCELELQARAKANRDETLTDRQIQKLQLQLQAYDAGLFDLWEVEILPANGNGTWRRVVVPARDSAAASAAALAQNPGYAARSVAKVQRRR